MIEFLILACVISMLGIEVYQMAQKQKTKCECEHLLKRIEHILWEIKQLLTPLPTGGTIHQLGEDGMPGAGSNSIQAGGAPGVFQASFTPPGSSVPSADVITFATNDPNAVVSPGPTSDPTTCSVTVPATDTNTSLVLACQLTGPDFPTPVNLTPLTVAILPAVTPPVLPTGGTINQLS